MYGIAFVANPASPFLVSASDSIQFWRVRDQSLRYQESEWTGEMVAVSPDGATLASGARHALQLQQIADGTLRDTVTITDGIYSMVWLADGQRVALGTANDQILAYNRETKAITRLITGTSPPNIITSLVQGVDEHSLVARSQDGWIRVWNSETGHHAGQCTGMVAS